jgi:hypothetical protein
VLQFHAVRHSGRDRLSVAGTARLVLHDRVEVLVALLEEMSPATLRESFGQMS